MASKTTKAIEKRALSIFDIAMGVALGSTVGLSVVTGAIALGKKLFMKGA
ncbi:MAG: hypothetical protein OXR68_00110 [Alphaproteobacteria bacterium]|nr:hypothetical protein [Alphaproteobacteria bacterium]MDD9919014.1 hypothetical protein [Alphaproteobacteria bacterium]